MTSGRIATAPLQLPLGVQLRESARLASFVAGPNGEAVAAARALAADGAAHLYLHGAAGTGKSHLLQATCRAASDAGRRAAYLPLAEFSDDDPTVLAGLDSLDMVCLDELDAVVGRRGWEEALVGLFDSLRAGRAGLLVAGRQPPGDLGLSLRDLSSRLGWGPVYALRELTDEQKRQVLTVRAAERGLELPGEVGRFLLKRSERDLSSLLSTLDRLDHASLAAKRRLTVPFVKQVLGV